MRKPVFSLLVGLGVLAAIAWQIQRSEAIPASVTISGVLKDARNQPLTGIYAAEVKFYRTETDNGPVATRTASVQVVDGVFSFSLIPDSALLDFDELWYSLAIDTEGDGIDTADLFPDRFEITSVPYALTAKPATFFNSHGGIEAGGGRSFGVSTIPWNRRLFLSPFVTPPGGVRFNRMSTYFADQFSTGGLSFGVYDRQGTAVYVSGLLPYFPGDGPVRQVEIDRGYLEPSSKYYTGWLFNGTQSPLLGNTHISAVWDTGYIEDPSFAGLIPQSFQREDIVHYNIGALNITFEYIENETIYSAVRVRASSKPLPPPDGIIY